MGLFDDLYSSQRNGRWRAEFCHQRRHFRSITAGLNAHADVLVQGITYTSAMPVLGGQAGFTVLTAPGNIGVGIDATLTGPRGNAISGGVNDNRTTLTDVFYQGTLKWNQGVHNEMVYITGNIPSGTYDSSRLANLSFGFPAVDAGAGYTYLDPKTGHEFSAVAGITYSFMNGALQYQNGMDFHVDWAASQFVSKTVHIGIAGYFLQQITDDRGPGAQARRLPRPWRSASVRRSAFMIPMSDGYQGYLNIRGYKDIEVENRPTSWSTWVTFSLSQAASAPAATKPIVRKY